MIQLPNIHGMPPAPAENSLQQKLIELDNRFTLLGGEGWFDLLDERGVLEHRIRQVGDFIPAMRDPPLLGRARVRGEFVRDSAAKAGLCACDWMCLWDMEAGNQASLADPFGTAPAWEDQGESDLDLAQHLERIVGDRIRLFRRLCESGCYPLVLQALQRLEPHLARFPNGLPDDFYCLAAFVRSRCGVAGWDRALHELLRRRPSRLTVFSLGLRACLHTKLVPGRDAAFWLQGGETLVEQASSLPSQADFLAANAAFLNRTGRAQAALECLQRAQSLLQSCREERHLAARVLAEIGESHRLLGNYSHARRALLQARHVQVSFGFRGELGRTLLYRAKMEHKPPRARFWLDTAEDVLRSCPDKVGLLKACLFRARLALETSPAEALKANIESLLPDIPALRSCAKLQLILHHWPQWCSGKPDPEGGTDTFWNV